MPVPLPPTTDFDAPPSEPLVIFREWFGRAEQSGLPNPNAMTLATVDAEGRPSTRIVLMKAIDERGVLFFTNYTSRKARELENNPRASLLFHWDPLNLQVRIEGRVTKATSEESDAYFATRPRESQIGAWASRQSQPVASRAELDAAVAEMEARFAGKAVPRPPHWGGYRVSLDVMEFWRGHEFRLHDRIVYMRGDDGWTSRRLFP